MPIEIRTVLRLVNNAVADLDKERIKRNKGVDYVKLQEAMLPIHTAWQEVQTVLRARRDLPDAVIIPCVRLAAAAIKLAASFCTPACLRVIYATMWLTTQSDDRTSPGGSAKAA